MSNLCTLLGQTGDDPGSLLIALTDTRIDHHGMIGDDEAKMQIQSDDEEEDQLGEAEEDLEGLPDGLGLNEVVIVEESLNFRAAAH